MRDAYSLRRFLVRVMTSRRSAAGAGRRLQPCLSARRPSDSADPRQMRRDDSSVHRVLLRPTILIAFLVVAAGAAWVTTPVHPYRFGPTRACLIQTGARLSPASTSPYRSTIVWTLPATRRPEATSSFTSWRTRDPLRLSRPGRSKLPAVWVSRVRKSGTSLFGVGTSFQAALDERADASADSDESWAVSALRFRNSRAHATGTPRTDAGVGGCNDSRRGPANSAMRSGSPFGSPADRTARHWRRP
jgi:hypothetical protein